MVKRKEGHARKAVGVKGEPGRDRDAPVIRAQLGGFKSAFFPSALSTLHAYSLSEKNDPRTVSTACLLSRGCEVEEQPGLVLFCLGPVLHPQLVFPEALRIWYTCKRPGSHMQKKGNCS